MTPDTLPIDRTFRGVGRIKKASGTHNPIVRNKINRMLTELSQDGEHLGILRALKSGQLSMLEVLDAFNRKALDKLPTGAAGKPLDATMEKWIDGLQVPDECSPEHQASLHISRNYFRKAKPNATLADLPAILESLRDSAWGRKHPRSFNLARSAAQALVRATLKRSHPLWLEVAAVEPRKVPKATERRPLTPDAMRGFFPNPETDQVDAIAWGMATTGMGQKEYWGRWETRSDRVHIQGTKREGRVRDVPLVRVPSPPRMHRRTFEDKLRERTDRKIRPYDLRRTYANWLESSGIPRTRRRIYRGHGMKDIGDLYEHHEITAFLIEDAGTIQTFLGLSHTAGHTVTPEAKPKLRVAK